MSKDKRQDFRAAAVDQPAPPATIGKPIQDSSEPKAGFLGETMPPRAAPDIAKAVHHLRRAANALPGDALRPVLEDYLALVLARSHSLTEAMVPRLTVDALGDVAAALDLDHHEPSKGAARDVRAAVEALA